VKNELMGMDGRPTVGVGSPSPPAWGSGRWGNAVSF